MGRVSDAQPAQVKYKEFSIKLNPQDRYYQNKKALVVVLSRSRLLALDCLFALREFQCFFCRASTIAL